MVKIPLADSGFENVYSNIECPVECFLFATNCFFDLRVFRADFGKNVAHCLRDDIDKFEEEWFVKAERATVADRATQNAPQNITTALVRRDDSICDREAQRANVIGDYAKRDVDFFLVVPILWGGCVSRRRLAATPYSWQRAGVFLSAQLFDLIV